jgi:hypothetical protein
MSTDANIVYLIYTGNPIWVRTLVEMLEDDGMEVDYEPPGDDPLFGSESVVTLVLAVTGHPSVPDSLNATVQTFRGQAPGAVVDIEGHGGTEGRR